MPKRKLLFFAPLLIMINAVKLAIKLDSKETAIEKGSEEVKTNRMRPYFDGLPITNS